MTNDSTISRSAIVLAAGKGTRMRSDLPKVMHHAHGRPMVEWVVDAARADALSSLLSEAGETVYRLGLVVPGAGVTYRGTLG